MNTTPQSSETSGTPEIEHKDFHEFAEVLPLLSKPELEGLAADIRKNGLNLPITLFEGRILDGRNRFLACQMIGVEPDYETYEGTNPAAYVISTNLHRRQLNKVQRALAAAKLWTLAGTFGGESADGETTRDEASLQLGCSPAGVLRASRIYQFGCKSLIAGVESGKFSLEPTSVVAHKCSHKEQEALAVAGRPAILERAIDLRRGNKRVSPAPVAPPPPAEEVEDSEPEPIGIFVGGSDEELMDEFTAAIKKIRPKDLNCISGRQDHIAALIDEIIKVADGIVSECPSIQRVEVEESGHLELLTETNDG